MSTLTFCYRNDKSKPSRTKMNDVDLKKSVTSFKSNISELIGLSATEIDIVYGGRCLREEESLELCGMKPGCTAYVLRKPAPVKQTDPEPVSWHQVITAVKSALQCPNYRNTVKRMLSDRDALENIIASVPGLDKDMAVIGMLHSPSLLVTLIHPDNIHKVLSKHPCFGQAAVIVAAAVNEDAVKNNTTAAHTDSYSLDQMSDDEDTMSGQPAQPANMPAGATGASQGITSSQLSAALAMATGMSPSRSSLSSQASQSASGSSVTSGPPVITSDFFRQAMQQATQQAGGTTSESEIQGQLQQLREMGIEDERVARRALEATGGDLLAALNLIFADENM